ncbi:MAG: helicase, partial [Acidobacteria bacterium]|nr:helicase [Acidobacteriota bacterium]
PLAQQWEEGFAHLQVFQQREGHCFVPQSFKTNDGYKLGTWVSHQRALSDSMSAERRQRLAQLGFVWDPFAQQWEEGFAHLQVFQQREGHCRVLRNFKTNDGYRLGSWVSTQRATSDSISAERRQRLDQLGFVWDMRDIKPKTR